MSNKLFLARYKGYIFTPDGREPYYLEKLFPETATIADIKKWGLSLDSGFKGMPEITLSEPVQNLPPEEND